MALSAPPLVLYSANTWLAYAIAENYYAGIHYVWCSPHFDASSVPPADYTVPPSSSPSEILRSLHEEVRRGDRHSARIAANRAGILRGVKTKREGNVITEAQATELSSIVAEAQIGDFRPLLYVIPYHLARPLIQEPAPQDKAHPLSKEYVIEELPRSLFDLIDFYGA